MVQRFTAESKIPKQSAFGFLHGYGARLWLLLWSVLNDIVLLKKIKSFSFSLTKHNALCRPDVTLRNEAPCRVNDDMRRLQNTFHQSLPQTHGDYNVNGREDICAKQDKALLMYTKLVGYDAL